MSAVAMQGTGASNMNSLQMGGKNSRVGEPDYQEGTGRMLSARELQMRKHYVPPAMDTDTQMRPRSQDIPAAARPNGADALPYWMNNYDGLPVPYAGPTEEKENFTLRAAVRQAAGNEITARREAGEPPGVIRTDPITDGEVAYLKSMKDQAELAKFEDYVESFIDPRQPGNMKWLMEIYPDYVNRRLQQAHTDYEFALRNQMIDCWGINTFDDLHFKYLVDQGKITGPRLLNRRPAIDMSYTPGVLSPWNFQSPRQDETTMRLPYASAVHGNRPRNPNNWTLERENRALGSGNNIEALAAGMYQVGNANNLPRGPFMGAANAAANAQVGGLDRRRG